MGNETLALEQDPNGVEDPHLVIDNEDGGERLCGRGHLSLSGVGLGALPFFPAPSLGRIMVNFVPPDRKSTRLNSSHLVISCAVFCLKKKTPALTGEIL